MEQGEGDLPLGGQRAGPGRQCQRGKGLFRVGFDDDCLVGGRGVGRLARGGEHLTETEVVVGQRQQGRVLEQAPVVKRAEKALGALGVRSHHAGRRGRAPQAGGRGRADPDHVEGQRVQGDRAQHGQQRKMTGR